jgi:hypothetical protein
MGQYGFDVYSLYAILDLRDQPEPVLSDVKDSARPHGVGMAIGFPHVS